MKRFFLFLLLAIGGTANAARQNILLIIADDYGVDSSSLYNSTNTGASLPPTPNINSLASNGVVFTRFYANPLCSPSRSCILTGQYGFRTGVGDVVGVGVTLTTNAFTLPEAFTNAALGYNLSQFGKWHLANPLNSPRTVGGWTNFLGCIPGQVADYYNWTKTTNGVSFTTTNYATTDLVNDATNWINARGTNAWFVWAAFNAPHTPNHLPPTNLCPHYATLPTSQAYINAHPRPYFEAAVEALDTEIGRLLTVVNRTNTHIIFIGDNGTLGSVIQPPFPSTRAKDTLYEGGTHVPLIISGLAVVNANRTNATLSSMADLFPTILEMAGSSLSAAVPSGIPIDGQSLLSVLQTTNTFSRYAFSELFGTNVVPQSATGQTLRNPQFKLIRFSDKHEEFYDLQNDPYETVNLLTNTLTATAQSNYFGLSLKLAGYQSALAQPVIVSAGKTNLQFTATVARATNLTYSLWRSPVLDNYLAWSPQTNSSVVTNGLTSVSLTDTNAGGAQNFYRVVGTPPRAMSMQQKNKRLIIALAFAGMLFNVSEVSAHLTGDPAHDWVNLFAAKPTSTNIIKPSFYTAPAGNGTLMASSFTPFKPKVRFYWDSTYFYEESDGMPDRTLMPNLMVGITSWQQHFPLFTSYFAYTTNPENDVNSLGYGKPNVWKFPLVPVPAASPLLLSSNNFQRGAVAIAANGVPIFNPRNNTGRFSYEIGELDQYGGHCGKADDYHYHIVPVHLQSVVGTNLPVAWALDGYPIYGYTEPDGTAQQTLDADGGHTNVTGSYHYHAIGSAASGPQNPYLMNAFHGTVVNYGGQVDGQPEAGSLRQTNTFGFQDKPVNGASITAFMNPVALTNDASGHFVLSSNGVASADQYLMRFVVGGTNYDICWRINLNANPKTLTVTWRMPGYAPFTTNYNNSNNRLTKYPMTALSLLKLPDTGQTNYAGTTFGQDADYTIYPQSFTDNGNGTITDNITGLMWQKIDNGESVWEFAVTNAASVTTGGYADWRLPTPTELFSMLNHNNNPAVDLNYFPNNPAGAAEYWWTTDIYGTNYANVWCANKGGGLGPKPKTETISAGGSLRYHARYVRGGAPSSGHNYLNNGDGTVSDLDTGLMWQQVPSAATNWSAALTNAESLSLGGYTDWRLPNIKELQTLTDYTLATATTAATAKACVNRVLFPTNTTPATAYWSSTPLRPVTGNQAWLVEFGINNSSSPPRNSQGIISYNTNSASYPFFCVRGPDQAFVMATPTRATNAVQVSWAASPGRTYSIFYSPTLNSVAWTNVGTIRCNGTSGSFNDTNAARVAQPVAFYKASYTP